MKLEKLHIKTALQKVTSRYPYQYSLDPYRGCAHHCEYCYAIYTQKYLGEKDFFDTIYVKENILEVLENELRSPKWKHQVVAIGTVCDAYQPIEAELKLMPAILKLMIKYRTPVVISTKSDLILRDFDLIKELASITYVNIAETITCCEDSLGKMIEPNAAPSSRRFHVLEKFKQTNATVGLHVMPIIPLINDYKQNIEGLYRIAANIKVDYVLNGTLYLRGSTRSSFMNFFKRYDHKHYEEFIQLYHNGVLDKQYKIALYSWIKPLMKQYHLSSDYMSISKDKFPKAIEQLSLF